ACDDKSRSLGSSMSIAEANVVINTIVADVLSEFADQLEAAVDIRATVEQIIVDTITNHKRIIFNGNNYAPAWREEAKRRGLLNLPSTPDALPYLIKEQNVALFERQHVYSREELHSRYEIQLENYCKILSIEAHTMLDMVNQKIIPAIIAYAGEVSASALKRREFLPELKLKPEEKLVRRLSLLLEGIDEKKEALQSSMDALDDSWDHLRRARHFRDQVFESMQALRSLVDEAEMIVDQKLWPFPGYGELLTTK
ncbi:MAG: glutamine synthetase, partial [Clostridia bacterium]|nr:glutamine synthetase [Clostridia bacterium]